MDTNPVLERLYPCLAGMSRRFIRKNRISPHLADDVCSCACARVWRYLGDVRATDAGSFEGWIRRIVASVGISLVRRERRHGEIGNGGLRGEAADIILAAQIACEGAPVVAAEFDAALELALEHAVLLVETSVPADLHAERTRMGIAANVEGVLEQVNAFVFRRRDEWSLLRVARVLSASRGEPIGADTAARYARRGGKALGLGALRALPDSPNLLVANWLLEIAEQLVPEACPPP